MRNLPLAFVDILIVWGTIIWMSVAIWKYQPLVTLCPRAVLQLSVAGDRAVTEYHGDELREVTHSPSAINSNLPRYPANAFAAASDMKRSDSRESDLPSYLLNASATSAGR